MCSSTMSPRQSLFFTDTKRREANSTSRLSNYARVKNVRAILGCNAVKPRMIIQLHPVAIIARNSTRCVTPIYLSQFPDPVGMHDSYRGLFRAARAFCSGVNVPD